MSSRASPGAGGFSPSKNRPERSGFLREKHPLMGWSGRAPAPPAISWPGAPRQGAAVRRRTDGLRRVTQLPDGQIRSSSDCPLSSLPLKKIPFRARPKSNPYFELSRPTEGRFAIVTDVGTGCDGRFVL